MIDPDVVLEEGVRVQDPAQVNLFGCRIGAHSFIGPFVEITRGVTVGRHCKIQSHAFLCDSVTVEDHVFVGHGVTFTNDLYPLVDRQVEYLPTRVEHHASLGSNATIIAGVTIGAHAIVGAGAVVTRDVPPLAIVAGNPARVLRAFDDVAQQHAYLAGRQASAVTAP